MGYLNIEEHISEEKKKSGREYNINHRRCAKNLPPIMHWYLR